VVGRQNAGGVVGKDSHRPEWAVLNVLLDIHTRIF